MLKCSTVNVMWFLPLLLQYCYVVLSSCHSFRDVWKPSLLTTKREKTKKKQLQKMKRLHLIWNAFDLIKLISSHNTISAYKLLGTKIHILVFDVVFFVKHCRHEGLETSRSL